MAIDNVIYFHDAMKFSKDCSIIVNYHILSFIIDQDIIMSELDKFCNMFSTFYEVNSCTIYEVNSCTRYFMSEKTLSILISVISDINQVVQPKNSHQIYFFTVFSVNLDVQIPEGDGVGGLSYTKMDLCQ